MMFEWSPQYVEYLDTFRKLGVRPFSKEEILRRKLGDYVSILVLRDILFSMLMLSPEKYTPYLYSWGKFIGVQSAHQAIRTLNITLLTRFMASVNAMRVLRIDVYRDALTKSWSSIKSSIPTITYIDDIAGVFRIKTEECDEAWGLPNISKKICFFEGAIVAGSTEGLMNKSINAVETKCVAHGDDYCEFLCRKDKEFPKLEIIDKRYYKKIKSITIKSFFEKKIIRPILGNYNHIASLQITYLGLWLTSTGSHTLLYWIGKESGKEIGERIKGSSNKKLKKFKSFSNNLKLGIVDIKKNKNKYVFSIKECAFCVGAKNFGKCICSYLAGLIAGFLEKTMKKRITVVETKCVAKGDKFCEFTTI